MINIQETPQITKIYLVTNCYGDPNKVYIGKTINNKRKNDHQIRFGKEIIFNYIDEINSLDSKDWKPLECFWISYFKFLGFELMNKNDGGGGNSLVSLKTRIKKSKQVIQYDLEGNFIKEWINIPEICKINDYHYNNIRECCLKINQFSYNFIWRFKGDKEILSNYKRPGKKILQYNTEGELLNEFQTLKEASNLLKCTQNGISQCLRGKSKTIKGYIFKYKK